MSHVYEANVNGLSERAIPALSRFMGRVVRHDDGQQGTCTGYRHDGRLLVMVDGYLTLWPAARVTIVTETTDEG